MGNAITLRGAGAADAEALMMSNGLTSVLISALALAGSRLATTDRQRELVIWLAEHDQSVLGIGTVGFALDELPWTREDFEVERRFLMAVCEAARGRLGWELLSYRPQEERLLPALGALAELLGRLTAADVDPGARASWLGEGQGTQPGFPRCERHGVLLTEYGCVVCND